MEPKKPALSSKSASEKKSGPWRPTKRQVFWVIGMVIALLTTALLIVSLHPEIWKGLLEKRNLTLIAIGVSVTAIIVLLASGGAASKWTGFRGMTVRDWLPRVGALLIPIMVGLGTGWITWQQAKLEDQRARQAQKLENQRAEAERKLAKQRAQDEALQAYVSQMSSLLLERDLRTPEKGSEVQTLARARTLTVLERLSPSRKRAVIQFLTEADLVQGLEEGVPLIRSMPDLYRIGAFERRQPSITLDGADLSDADLEWANLSGADLSNAWGVTNEQLRAAKSLKGTTLPGGQTLRGAQNPNGPTFEDWLKDKKTQRKDEKKE